MKAFDQQFYAVLAFVSRVLDVGAGQGDQAAELADLGHIVVAIERRPVSFAHQNVEWHRAKIEDWIVTQPDGMFDAILLRHTIQFMAPAHVCDELVPHLKRLVRPGGIVAIETFTKQPEPAFESDHPSYWHHAGLEALFKEYIVDLSDDVEETYIGMDGVERHWYLTRFIARKPE